MLKMLAIIIFIPVVIKSKPSVTKLVVACFNCATHCQMSTISRTLCGPKDKESTGNKNQFAKSICLIVVTQTHNTGFSQVIFI